VASLFGRRPDVVAPPTARPADQVEALRDLLAEIRGTCTQLVARSDVRNPLAKVLDELLINGVLSIKAERRALNKEGGEPR
jgi:hypothetical protein